MKLKQKLTYAILGFLVGNLILLSAFFGYTRLTNPPTMSQEISFAKGLQLIRDKEISGVHIYDDSLKLRNNDGKELEIKNVNSDAMKESILKESKHLAEVKFHPSSNTGWRWLIILNLAPLILLISILAVLIRIFVKLSNNNKSMK